uniref:Uncharacterized protein n=1 Tax=Saccharum officinarum TaxID=4547 RepID=A0A678T691_SACOF|nr:hypothetical protein SO13M23_000010 [Saccharum officinarum]
MVIRICDNQHSSTYIGMSKLYCKRREGLVSMIEQRLFFTCLPAGFEPGTWVNIIGTTMPSQFHLISSYPRASPMMLYRDQRLFFFTCLPAGFDPGTWVNVRGTNMPIKNKAIKFQCGAMINNHVTLSLDGHAIPCVITRTAPLIVSGKVDLVIRDDRDTRKVFPE